MASVLKEHIFKLDSVVVGSSLPALIYAHLNDLPVLSGPLEPPFEFDFFDVPETLGVKNQTELITNEGLKILGVQKLLLWNRLYFDMSLRGKIPMGDKADRLELNLDERRALCVTSFNGRLVTFEFKKAFVFDWRFFEGIQKKKITKDWLSLWKIDFKEDYDILNISHETEDYNLKQILFYLSPRRNLRAKDAIVVYEGKAPETLSESKFVFTKEVDSYVDDGIESGRLKRKRSEIPKIIPQHRDEIWKAEHQEKEIEIGEGVVFMDFSEEYFCAHVE